MEKGKWKMKRFYMVDQKEGIWVVGYKEQLPNYQQQWHTISSHFTWLEARNACDTLNGIETYWTAL